MAIKKSALYNSLWQSCDELRGGMDASQYKDYVLTLLFMKYVSDKYENIPNAVIEVPHGASFGDMAKLKGDKEIGDKINKIIRKMAEKNDLRGVIDVADFLDDDKLGKGKEMVDRLTKLVAIFETIDLGGNRIEGDDLLGDAYEYLMRHFATESGKSKGQFYTPAEVSRILAKVVGITQETSQDDSIYDPTCGSGSLLLKAADEAPRGLSIYGQEMDNSTYALATMNMILHGDTSADIHKGNTLANPYWKDKEGGLKRFDFAVANPPFSYKAWSNGLTLSNDEFNRFKLGVPPMKNGDYAFLLHILTSLKSTGKAAVILPHGVLFRGNVEADIRRQFISRGYIKGIIGLPANLFYGTGIPACIIILDKENAMERKEIFMMDSSKEFMKDGNKNRLRDRDIHKIVDVFNRKLEIPRYSRMVTIKEIKANDSNLNIPRYIDSSEPEDLHDLDAHMNGGIPISDINNLEGFWQVFPDLRQCLFAPAREGYVNARVPANEVKTAIMQHKEYQNFARRSMALYQLWRKKHFDTLNDLEKGCNPKMLIFNLSEDILQRIAGAELIDKYAIYQIIMDYWDQVMQDDIYLISQDGWESGNRPRMLVEEKGVKVKETPDLIIKSKKYKTDLIPPLLIIARYFVEEQAEINRLQVDKDKVSQQLDTFIEEHSGDEGLLEEAKTDKGKISKTSIKNRLSKSKDPEELNVLRQCRRLLEDETAVAKAVKEAQKMLDTQVFMKYPNLSIEEIKSMVVKDKWLNVIEREVESEIERVTGQLANRVKLLEERYINPLPKLVDNVTELTSKVEGHLKQMGLVW